MLVVYTAEPSCTAGNGGRYGRGDAVPRSERRAESAQGRALQRTNTNAVLEIEVRRALLGVLFYSPGYHPCSPLASH